MYITILTHMFALYTQMLLEPVSIRGYVLTQACSVKMNMKHLVYFLLVIPVCCDSFSLSSLLVLTSWISEASLAATMVAPSWISS